MSRQQSPAVVLGATFASMCLSVALYVLLAWLMEHQILPDQKRPLRPAEWLPSLRPVLVGVGVALLLLPHVLETWWLSRLSNAPSAARYRLTFIAGLALCEATAILGLVLFFVGLPLREFYYFAAASLLGMIIWGGPRLRPYAEAIERSGS